MALDEIIGPFFEIFLMALLFFPAVYLIDSIRRRLSSETFAKKLLAVFISSYLIILAIYPLIVSELLLPFNSADISYVLALAFLFVVYLIVYNRTKE